MARVQGERIGKIVTKEGYPFQDISEILLLLGRCPCGCNEMGPQILDRADQGGRRAYLCNALQRQTDVQKTSPFTPGLFGNGQSQKVIFRQLFQNIMGKFQRSINLPGTGTDLLSYKAVDIFLKKNLA